MRGAWVIREFYPSGCSVSSRVSNDFCAGGVHAGVSPMPFPSSFASGRLPRSAPVSLLTACCEPVLTPVRARLLDMRPGRESGSILSREGNETIKLTTLSVARAGCPRKLGVRDVQPRQRNQRKEARRRWHAQRSQNSKSRAVRRKRLLPAWFIYATLWSNLNSL